MPRRDSKRNREMEAPLVPEGVVLERAMALLKEFETGEFAGESLELTNEILAGLREEYGESGVGRKPLSLSIHLSSIARLDSDPYIESSRGLVPLLPPPPGNATVGAYEEVIAKAVGQNMSSVGQKRKTTEEEAPAAAEGSEKKPKVEAKAAIDAKAPVKAEVVKAEAGAEPNANVQLSKTRFLKVSNWSGKTFADFREWYEKDGEMKPGKKGISLSLDQWEIFKVCPTFRSQSSIHNPRSWDAKPSSLPPSVGRLVVRRRTWARSTRPSSRPTRSSPSFCPIRTRASPRG